MASFVSALDHLFKGKCKSIRSESIPIQGSDKTTFYEYKLSYNGHVVHMNNNLNIRIDTTVSKLKWTLIYE